MTQFNSANMADTASYGFTHNGPARAHYDVSRGIALFAYAAVGWLALIGVFAAFAYAL